MALVSSKVAAGITILAEHFNKLWTDMTQNHNHSSGQGGTVSHGDLSDGVVTGTYTSHDVINNHIQADGTEAEPDGYGGARGVHGLPAAQYVFGSPGIVASAGDVETAATEGAGTLHSGQVVALSGFHQTDGGEFTIPFPASYFATKPIVLISPTDDSTQHWRANTFLCNVVWNSITTSQFKVWSNATAGYPVHIHWIAIGQAA